MMFRAACLLTIAFVTASCSQLGALGDALAPYTPKLQFRNLALKNIDFSKVDVDFVFAVRNPNPISVKLASFGYALGLEGVEMLRGTQADGFKLEARGESELAIPVSLTYTRIFELIGAARGKDRLAFDISGDLGFDTPVGRANVPFRERGDFPVVHAPDVSLKKLAVGDFNLLKGQARLDLTLGMANTGGGSALGFQNFRYNVSLMGQPVLESVLANVADVGSGETRDVVVPIALNLLTAGKALVDAVSQKKALDVGFAGVVDVRTPFGVIPLDVKRLANMLLK
jgi:LEA14-like dessication related protein